MRLARTARIKGEGGIALLVIVLLLLGGIVWWLYSSRQDAEKNARIFAVEVAKRVAVNYDEKYLHVKLSPEAQVQFLKSARDRLIDRLREFGVPAQPIELQGDVAFTSYFFDPHATFRAQLKYPTTSAELELSVSRGMTVWQVDTINLIWIPPPVPTPTPGVAPVATPTPTPTPTPEPKAKRKRNG
jgi:hypothetical protein